MNHKIIFLSFSISFLFVSIHCIPQGSSCGRIYDGLTNGKFDLQSQTSNSTIAANWFDFPSDVLFYEWGIISDELRLPTLNGENGCINNFRLIPNIQSWKNMNKQTSGINTKLHLKYEKTYFNIIRATLKSGTQLIAISNGITITRQDFSKENLIFTAFPSEKLNERSVQEEIVPCQCPIDENNRAIQSKIPVSDRLNEIYGPPNFLTDQLVEFVVYGSIDPESHDDDDDDDDQAPAWILAPVIVGSFLFYCIILLLALLGILLFRRSAGPPEERQSNVAFDQSKKEAKSYGQREGMDVVDATTETRVEFPDTNIRRLSISHDTDPPLEDLGVAEDSGRGRKHPIMSSASSSFRDYRSSVSH